MPHRQVRWQHFIDIIETLFKSTIKDIGDRPQHLLFSVWTRVNEVCTQEEIPLFFRKLTLIQVQMVKRRIMLQKMKRKRLQTKIFSLASFGQNIQYCNSPFILFFYIQYLYSQIHFFNSVHFLCYTFLFGITFHWKKHIKCSFHFFHC